jgi:hypothetical protein
VVNLRSARKKGNAVQILAFRHWNMLDSHALFTMADYTIFVMAMMEAQAKYPLEIGFYSEEWYKFII